MNLLDDNLTNEEAVLWTLIFVIITVIVFTIAELFRRRIFIAFYTILLLFMGCIPFIVFDSAPDVTWFMRTKYFIVIIPYLLIVVSLISIISDQDYKNNLSTINRFIHSTANRICNINILLQEDKQELINTLNQTDHVNDDIYGHANWFSLIAYITIIVNILVAVIDDVIHGGYTNAICGVILCLPLNTPIPIKSWSVSQKYEYYLYVNDQHNRFELRIFSVSSLYIFTYVSWNLCLLLNVYKRMYTIWMCMVHLGVPLCRVLWNRRIDLWWQYRALALAMELILNNVKFIKSFHLHEAATFVGYKGVFLIWGSLNIIFAIINWIMQYIQRSRHQQTIRQQVFILNEDAMTESVQLHK